MADDSKLGDAIRSIVRDELGVVQEARTVVPWRDVMWASIGVVDVFLMVFLVPEDTLNNSKVKFFYEKLLPWLCTTVFVSLFTVFKERSKTVLQHRWFQATVAALCALLTMFVVPWFTIDPDYGPQSDIVVKLDESVVDAAHPLSCSIPPHLVTVEPRNPDPDLQKVKYRVSWAARTDTAGQSRPHWTMWRRTTLEPGIHYDVVTFVFSGPFTKSFLDAGDNAIIADCPTCKTSNAGGNLEIRVSDKESGSVWLPLGSYRVVIRKGQCKDKELPPVSITAEAAVTVSAPERCEPKDK